MERDDDPFDVAVGPKRGVTNAGKIQQLTDTVARLEARLEQARAENAELAAEAKKQEVRATMWRGEHRDGVERIVELLEVEERCKKLERRIKDRDKTIRTLRRQLAAATKGPLG
jgi:predicted RNase H-like nuclease (RuvC/YqgF family)